MKLQRTQLFPNTSNIKDPETKKFADKLIRMLDDLINKIAGIPFNRSESLTVADSGSADTEFSITHHLGRVPAGFILTKSDKAAVLYDSGSAWTTTTIYLKCNVANAALTVSVF